LKEACLLIVKMTEVTRLKQPDNMFKPVNKKILFKPFRGDEKTQGGLFVPDSVRKLSNKGEIVEVGDRVTKVSKGDIGFRVQSWGDEIIVNGEKMYIMEEGAILALA